MINDSTICAISTPPGIGGIAVVRVSGPDAFDICDKLFVRGSSSSENGKPSSIENRERRMESISECAANTVVYGNICKAGEVLDDVLVAVFRAPNSFTGENTVEISCHGSLYIQQRLMQWLIESGGRQANPGEFTQRAFINGKMDLSQAEAVADLIASTSAGMHRLAMNQMRGGFSDELTA